MRSNVLLGMIALLVAVGALAQPGEKPKIALPEPTRQPPAEAGPLFTITVVEYNLADKNRDTFPQAIHELIAFFQAMTDVKANLRWNKLRLSNRSLSRFLSALPSSL